MTTYDHQWSAARSAAINRFWAKVDRSGECWEWRGYRDRQGYGHVMRDGVNYLAHRYAYTLAKGEPEGVVRHTCDNPPCVRPSHLLDGTQADNIADRQARGRHRPGRLFGEDHPAHKLTNAQVIEIRALRAQGFTGRVLAARYGVHLDTIYRVSRRQEAA